MGLGDEVECFICPVDNINDRYPAIFVFLGKLELQTVVAALDS